MTHTTQSLLASLSLAIAIPNKKYYSYPHHFLGVVSRYAALAGNALRIPLLLFCISNLDLIKNAKNIIFLNKYNTIRRP